MKRTIGFALATGLALLVAGCASQGGGASSGAAGGGMAEAQPAAARNFNLAVKCPGVHYLKKKGWTDQQIMEQESLTEASDIPACEDWVAHQPKGYVPAAPPGSTAAAAVKASNAPGPNAAPSPAQ
ncbi:MAG TPA: hypothetical protein VMA09_10175 [Candidatus Binataceae bacterium]|nr:hypothetical protein [Candidatus Binataceae bacterium]